jgi:hypothetical protein
VNVYVKEELCVEGDDIKKVIEDGTDNGHAGVHHGKEC